MVNDIFIDTDNAQTYAYIIKEKASIRKVEALMDNKEITLSLEILLR